MAENIDDDNFWKIIEMRCNATKIVSPGEAAVMKAGEDMKAGEVVVMKTPDEALAKAFIYEHLGSNHAHDPIEAALCALITKVRAPEHQCDNCATNYQLNAEVQHLHKVRKQLDEKLMFETRRTNVFTDILGSLRTRNDELLIENATQRRRVEELENLLKKKTR